MINGEKSKLLIKTFDGSLKNLKVKPKGINSIVEFTIQYYDYEREESLVKAKVIFYEVVSIDFEVNLFDNCIGAELFGFYEIFQEEKKKELVETIVRNRRDGFLYHGNYDYDETDENDMLNWRESVEKLYENIKEYHLYQQQTEGGIYYILAKRFEIIRK